MYGCGAAVRDILPRETAGDGEGEGRDGPWARLRQVIALTRVFLLLLFALFWGPLPVYASCAGPLSVAEEFRSSDAVFSGVAVRVAPNRSIGPLVVFAAIGPVRGPASMEGYFYHRGPRSEYARLPRQR